MVSFIRRSTNIIAHTLARASISYVCVQIFDQIPTCIYQQIINEMS